MRPLDPNDARLPTHQLDLWLVRRLRLWGGYGLAHELESGFHCSRSTAGTPPAWTLDTHSSFCFDTDCDHTMANESTRLFALTGVLPQQPTPDRISDSWTFRPSSAFTKFSARAQHYSSRIHSRLALPSLLSRPLRRPLSHIFGTVPPSGLSFTA